MIKDEERAEFVPIIKPLKNRGFTSILDGATIATIVFLFVAVVLLYLTNISVDLNMGWKEFGYEAIILYIFTVTINFLMRSIAKRKGRENERHKKAYQRVSELEQHIIEKGLRGFERDYCREWEEDELRDARKNVLSFARVDIDTFEDTYLKYSKKELKRRREELQLTDGQLKIIFKAKRIKRLRYNEKYLSTTLKAGRRVSPTGEINTAKYERIRTVQYLFTAFAGVCVSASMALNIIAEPTFGTVVMCIIKIVTILISAIFGMTGGYKLTAELETNEFINKSLEQLNFIKWCEKNLTVNTKSVDKNFNEV